MSVVRLHAAPPRQTDDDFDVIGAEALPRIPPGVYEAFGTGRVKRYQPFGPKGPWKVRVLWTVRVPDAGAPDGFRNIILPRYYQAARKHDGRLDFGPTTDYTREWTIAAGRRPTRADRKSPTVFKGVCCAVEVRDTKSDRSQRVLHLLNVYSVIGRVLDRRAGGAPC